MVIWHFLTHIFLGAGLARVKCNQPITEHKKPAPSQPMGKGGFCIDVIGGIKMYSLNPPLQQMKRA